jgi:hypothetical protein
MIGSEYTEVVEMKTRWIDSVIEASKAEDVKLPFGRLRRAEMRGPGEADVSGRQRKSA